MQTLMGRSGPAPLPAWRSATLTRRACYAAYAVIGAALLVVTGCDQKRSDEPLQGDGARSTQPPPASAPGEAVKLTWNVPEGWVSEQPSSAMRQAQFKLPSPFDDGGDAVAVVFYFQGQGGGVDANVQRWYSQFKQPDGRNTADIASVMKAAYNGLNHTLVDVKGTFLFQERMMGPVTEERENYRLLADVIETSGGPWFVKVTGPVDTMDFWAESFYDFTSSIQPES